jgi:hypothetical protein
MWIRALAALLVCASADARPHPREVPESGRGEIGAAAALGLELVPPKEWAAIPVVANDQLMYDAAWRAPDGRFELRIALRDDRELDRTLAQQRASSGFVGVTDPVALWSALVQAPALNISNGTAGRPTPLPHEILASSYGSATDGAIGDLEPAGRFAAGWPRCAMVAIRRGSVNAFVMLMYRDAADLRTKAPDAALASLRFTGNPLPTP